MGVHVHGGTMPGGVTPICDDCGVALCWDLSAEEYAEAKAFWDAWICRACNGDTPLSLKAWQARQAAAPKAAQPPYPPLTNPSRSRP